MAQKAKTLYVCSACGHESAKWYGCCPGCGEWNTMEEVFKAPEKTKASGRTASVGFNSNVQMINDISCDGEVRHKTGLEELDRVLGGGIVKGSLVLLSGDPGIGKSTLLLQICQYLGRTLKILYVSGEESAHQIKLRADRLGVNTENLFILCETDVQIVAEHMRASKPDLVIIDSIQTMNVSELNSSLGSVAQVRECTNCLMQTSKSLNIPTIVVGHVNKDGNIAGPKVLEHIVDAVLYFEGERHLSYRILRAVKNRYGSTNEIGVFEMKDNGLSEVENPSEMMISGRPKNTSGSCVACLMEGSRPILAEVQALVSASGYGNPRRMTNGFDYNRLAMLAAVLEKRAGFFLSNCDIYINVVGGLKLDEPASDLSVALALISSLKDTPIRDDVITFGEIGLGGEIRSIGSCEQRIKEAARLGFNRCIVPYHNYKNLNSNIKSLVEIVPARTIRAAFDSAI